LLASTRRGPETVTLTRAEQLRAGRAWNKMIDHECGIEPDGLFPEGHQVDDPTGEMGWTMLTIEADRQANWDSRTYEEILATKAQDVLAWENAS